jgi:hypothetical protein
VSFVSLCSKCQSSLEMSPLGVLLRPLFSCFAAAPLFFSKNSRKDALGTTTPHLHRPTASPVLLAWSGAQPCDLRGAERLGRSGGPGQRRPRCHCPFGRLLRHHSASCLSPRVICRRHALPFRARLGRSLHHGFRLRHYRTSGRRDFLPYIVCASDRSGHRW